MKTKCIYYLIIHHRLSDSDRNRPALSQASQMARGLELRGLCLLPFSSSFFLPEMFSLVSLAVLELPTETRVALNARGSAHLCLHCAD